MPEKSEKVKYPKKRLAFTGSPRKGENSARLAEAFIQGAESVGHTVVRFEAGRKETKGCMACRKCYSKGVACVFPDGFDERTPLVEQSELRGAVTPLLWFTSPAQVKAVVDKRYALYAGKRQVKVKESRLLVCAETEDPLDFEEIVRSYELIDHYLEWTDRGKLRAPGVKEAGDLLCTGALAQVREMGRSLQGISG